jgi:hypothetical protein
MRKRQATYPDTLIIWDVTWTKQEEVWVGLAITDPEDPALALSVAYQRIVRRDGRYVMVDPGLTLDRFGWDEDDVTITDPPEEEDR